MDQIPNAFLQKASSEAQVVHSQGLTGHSIYQIEELKSQGFFIQRLNLLDQVKRLILLLLVGTDEVKEVIG